MTRSLGTAAVAVVLATAVAACDPCAGTGSCHGEPELSYNGQFVERFSGRPMPGVHVVFIRRSGARLSADSVFATTDGDGFFELRALSYDHRAVIGDLRVEPPAPYPPYTVRGLSLGTTRTRGNGGALGRLVVNPYVQLLGVMQRPDESPAAGLTIHLRVLNGAGLVDQVESTMITSDDGRFLWTPTLLGFDTLHVQLTIDDASYTSPLVIERVVLPQYRDAGVDFLVARLKRSLRYLFYARRRGTGESVSGITARFVRTSGIALHADSVEVSVGSNGLFTLELDPAERGAVTGTLTIVTPPPYRTESRTVTIETHDDDSTPYYGSVGYGAAATFEALFLDASGKPLPEGTLVRVQRTGGLATVELPNDIGLRGLDSHGVLGFSAATADTGQVTFDLEVRRPQPAAWDTVRAVKVPSRLNDDAFVVGPFHVGTL